MRILISLAIIIVSVSTWAILRVASDADDELDDYREIQQKETEN